MPEEIVEDTEDLTWKDHREMADELVEFSFRNLVWFYRDELMKIHRGEARAREFFSQSQSGRLSVLGIYYLGSKRGDRWHVLTEKTLKVLSDLEKEEH